LDVVGNARVSSYYLFNGNPGNPGDSSASIYDQAGVGPTISGLNVAFRAGSTPAEIMRVTGNSVGIGTTSPTSGATLAVAGNILVQNTNNSVYFGTGAVTYGDSSAIGRASTNGFHISGSIAGDLCIGAEFNASIRFGTGASGTLSQRMAILAGGNVAIGNENTSDVNERLNVTGNGIAVEATDGGIRTLIGTFGGTDSIIGTYTNNNLQIRTNNNSRIFVTNTGDVGVGTTGPSSRLDVRPTTSIAYQGTVPYQSTTAAILSPVLTAASSDTYTSILQLVSVREALVSGRYAHGYLGFTTVDNSNVDGVKDAGRISIKNDDGVGLFSGTSLGFWTNTGGSSSNPATERMRITSGGNVLIGTTTDGGYKLDVNGNTNVSGGTITAGSETTYAFRVLQGKPITLGGDDNYAYIQSWSSGPLVLNSQGNNVVFPNSSTQVGIGTYSPDAILHVAKATSSGVGGQIVIDNPSSSAVGNAAELSFLTDAGASGSGVRNAKILAVNVNAGNGAAELQFFTWNGAAELKRLNIASNGVITMSAYGSGNVTGTPTYNLAVDSSGNIIETAGGVVDGSGPANYVTKWQDANTVTNSQVFDNGTNVGINNASPKTKLDVNGEIGFGSKTVSLSDSFVDALTVNLTIHRGVYVKITAFGDWGGHSTIAYLGEFFLQNGDNAYAEPGVIIRQVDNTANDDILAQIVDPAGTGTRDFVIQLKTTSASSTPFNAQMQYEVRGVYNSVS
jgi:hypothetical protein